MIGRLRTLLPWLAPVVSMAVVSVSISLTVPLFALLMNDLGASGTEIGFNHTLAALAMVGSAPLMPRVMAVIGLIPMMIGAAVVLGIALLIIPLWESVIWWGALRLIFGIVTTALFFGSEFWLVALAPDAMRGRIVGMYVLILSVSYMMGPLLLNGLGTEGYAIYIVPSVIAAVSIIPIFMGRGYAPPPEPGSRPGLLTSLKFFRTDPMIVWGVVLFGVIEFGAMGLSTIWGLRTGFDQATAVSLVFWLAFGSMAFQVLVGWAADRFDRRALLTGAAVFSVIMPLVAIWAAGVYVIVAAAFFIWGGMAVAFYSLALIELGSRYKGAILADGNAALMLAYGLGALVGPAMFGAAMDAIPPDGLMWLAAIAAIAYLGLALVRIYRVSRDALDSGRENSS